MINSISNLIMCQLSCTYIAQPIGTLIILAHYFFFSSSFSSLLSGFIIPFTVSPMGSLSRTPKLGATAPDTVQVKVTPMHGGQGYVCPISLPAYKAAEKGFEIAFGKKPLAVRRGGSIPIISTFEQVLGIKTVLMGFGLESDAIHSPNENFSLDIFRKGIEAVVEFYKEYGK